MKESKNWSKFCMEPSKIEGYDRAINDTSDTVYACHHRLETHTSDGIIRSVPLSMKELKALDMYYHRPAEELIIITVREHQQLHRLVEGNNNYASKEEYKEAHKEQYKQYYTDPNSNYAQYQKQYQDEHKEHIAERCKRWYEANKEYKKRRTKVSHWIKRNPTSTDFPTTWNDEDIKMFYELNK